MEPTGKRVTRIKVGAQISPVLVHSFRSRLTSGHAPTSQPHEGEEPMTNNEKQIKHCSEGVQEQII